MTNPNSPFNLSDHWARLRLRHNLPQWAIHTARVIEEHDLSTLASTRLEITASIDLHLQLLDSTG